MLIKIISWVIHFPLFLSTTVDQRFLILVRRSYRHLRDVYLFFNASFKTWLWVTYNFCNYRWKRIDVAVTKRTTIIYLLLQCKWINEHDYCYQSSIKSALDIIDRDNLLLTQLGRYGNNGVIYWYIRTTASRWRLTSILIRALAILPNAARYRKFDAFDGRLRAQYLAVVAD